MVSNMVRQAMSTEMCISIRSRDTWSMGGQVLPGHAPKAASMMNDKHFSVLSVDRVTLNVHDKLLNAQKAVRRKSIGILDLLVQMFSSEALQFYHCGKCDCVWASRESLSRPDCV
ncbi:hypothetical protein FVE85_8747 [Porphyridium purpureum]|uniref:Uncharacterized protein n=1 Tax=Porphyridium purpureum TaxID=35688 RepID=A0A5J4YR70_PORPP|nr:hypothetical protein FVE85_8747 [Porphyridium purpureum]|eukprot:POR2318..scf296_7